MTLAIYNKSRNPNPPANSERVGDKSGTINLGIARGTLGGRNNAGKLAVEASSEHYDPQWANVLEFLDAIERRQLIQRDLEVATIGQLTWLRGIVGF